jgi:hypothetical protein
MRSVVQQVHGESQGKWLDLELSTPYSGSTSAPSNTGTLYLGDNTASGNPSNIASTSTLHLGVSMGNPATSPTANLPYPGGASTSSNLGFPTHTTPTNPNPNF